MAEGRLAKDKILENNTILQENGLLTTIVNAPLPPPTIPLTFSFLVSFKKFHVTAAPKAGYNKIYESRRSNSFFFEVVDQIPDTNEIHLKIYTNDYHMPSTPIRYYSTSKLPNHRFQISKCLTHFFLNQRVIPRRIQNKFFNFIRLKLLECINLIKSRADNITCNNNATKTFFNFSYKRYRFYFGIYVACNHISTNKFQHQKTGLCLVPSPFVKNFGRHACVQHRSLMPQNPVPKDNVTSVPIGNNSHHKSFHANLIYEKYSNNSIQRISSQRLGISYETSYIARDLNLISPPNKVVGRMYTKVYKKFTRSPSANPRTAARQNIHFNRACRRTFNQLKPKKGQALKLREKLSIAKLHKFLFYPYQTIYSRVSHLKFNKGLFNRYPNVPLFRFPYDRNRSLLHLSADQWPTPILRTQETQDLEEDDSSTDDGSVGAIENSYKAWYISNLIDEHYGQGASEYIDAISLIQDTTVELSLRDAQMLGLNDDRMDEIKARDRKNERLNVIQDVQDHNTSAKHYLRRTNMMTFLTQLTDAFHDRIIGIRKFAFKKHTVDKRIPTTKRLNNLVMNYGKNYRDEHYPFKPYRAIIGSKEIQYIKDDLGDTSDDTIILERRPKKRRARISHYENFDGLTQLTKKVCIFDCRDTKEEDFLPANIDLFFKFRT